MIHASTQHSYNNKRLFKYDKKVLGEKKKFEKFEKKRSLAEKKNRAQKTADRLLLTNKFWFKIKPDSKCY
jgi:hypothetical protein